MARLDKLLLTGMIVSLVLIAIWAVMRASGVLPTYMPHGVCWLGSPYLIWLMAIGNTLIFLSYSTIAFVFLRLLVRVNMGAMSPIVRGFGMFIITCGLTHLCDVLMIWYGWFWLQTILILACVLPSAFTAIYLLTNLEGIIKITSEIFKVYRKD